MKFCETLRYSLREKYFPGRITAERKICVHLYNLCHLCAKNNHPNGNPLPYGMNENSQLICVLLHISFNTDIMSRLKEKTAVIGGGSWATAIVKILTSNLSTVGWWVREPEIEEGIKKKGRNPLYLRPVLLNKKQIQISTNLKEIVSEADTIILAVPSAYIYGTLSTLEKKCLQDKNIVSAIKGIVPERMQTVSSYIFNSFDVPEKRFCVISGPSHAEEIASEKLTYLTSGSSDVQLADTVADLFRNQYVKVHTSSDMQGIEFSIVLKNIYALAGGILRGTGAGDNLSAVFNTNCLNEMVHFIETLFPNTNRNVFTAPYLGDFLVTAYSQYSRNRSFGMMIGQGYSVRAAQLEMEMVAEGFHAVRCIHELNLTYKANIPIIETVYRILYENAPLKKETQNILNTMK
ncbi:MAG: NAD(P)-binding domain-containing protein [Bacteroidales bacterium]|nr:NAD(P)-binding domain-containing protein [Bacteroidales bacterium]